MCQSQMDDAEGKCSQPYDGDDCSWNQILTTFNHSQPFLEGWSQKPLMLIDINLEDTTNCNNIFVA